MFKHAETLKRTWALKRLQMKVVKEREEVTLRRWEDQMERTGNDEY